MPEDNKRGGGYLAALATSAPIFGAKALIGDLPKGALEYAVQSKASGTKGSFAKHFKQGLKGRGAGRAMGAGIGILTAPIFIKGLRLASSKKREDQLKGIGLLAASGGVYAGQKGFVEGFQQLRASGAGKVPSIGKGLRLGVTRAAYKIPAAVALGLSVAKGRSKKGPSTAKDKYLVPAAAGALLGALSRGGEEITDIIGTKGKPKSMASFARVLRKATPAALGGAAGGILGGVVLAGAVEGTTRLMKKNAHIEKQAVAAAAAAIGTGKFLAEVAGIHLATKGALGYGRMGKLFSAIPGPTRWLQTATTRAKSRQLAIGIREGLAGRTTEGWRGALGNLAIPELRMNRQFGLKLGKGLRSVPERHRAKMLGNLQEHIKRNPKYTTDGAGDPISVLSSIPDGIDMALGKKGLYAKADNALAAKIKGAWKHTMHTGRGIVDERDALGKLRTVKGLPTAGRADKPLSSKKYPWGAAAPDLLAMGTGIAGLAGGIPSVPGLTAHLGWTGGKGAFARTKALQNMAAAEGASGIRMALMPGLKGRWKDRPAGRAFMDALISPEQFGFGRLSGGLAAGGLSAAGKGISRRVKAGFEGATVPKKLRLADAMKYPAAAGVGAAGLANLVDSRKRG